MIDVTFNCGTQIQTKFPKGNLTKGGYSEIVNLSFQQPETEQKEKPWHHFLWHPLFSLHALHMHLSLNKNVLLDDKWGEQYE